jgi:hypothetical protein
MHVLIIGGGTRGMCLAHGLRRAGVSVPDHGGDGVAGVKGLGEEPGGRFGRWRRKW